MSHRAAFFALASLLLPLSVSAQDHAGHSEHAGKEERPIKALSDQRIAELLEGAGAGYALSAELNGYPGPRHVLDLRGELELTADQTRAVEAIFMGMQTRARELGADLVEAERAIESAFRAGDLEPARLAELVEAAAVLDGRLRLNHLAAHIETRALLSDRQIAEYDRLRGYSGGGS